MAVNALLHRGGDVRRGMSGPCVGRGRRISPRTHRETPQQVADVALSAPACHVSKGSTSYALVSELEYGNEGLVYCARVDFAIIIPLRPGWRPAHSGRDECRNTCNHATVVAPIGCRRVQTKSMTAHTELHSSPDWDDSAWSVAVGTQ